MKTYKVNNAQRLRFDDPRHQLHIYNGLDGLTTSDLFERMSKLAPPSSLLAAKYEHAMLGPVLSMMRRGILIDKERLDPILTSLRGDLSKCLKAFSAFTRLVWPDQEVNPNSPAQINKLFIDHMAVPRRAALRFKQGEVKESFDRDQLEKLSNAYLRCKPYCDILLRIRDLERQLDVLTKALTPDGRFTYSFNIAGTDTWRFSSSNSPFGLGQNVQNIDPRIRNVFIPDPSFTLCYLDLQGAEARVVAYLCGDENYIRTVESADSHTEVCKMVWPELHHEALNYGWNEGDDRAIAEQEFYRSKSYRDLAKRYAHGSNYYGKPRTLATETKTTTKQAEDFQDRYFDAYPGIQDWQQYVIGTVQTTGKLSNPFGMERTFWNRLNDDSTLRSAIAFGPQSTIGVLMNIGIRLVWETYEGNDLQILANGHDAVLLQIRTSELDKLLPDVLQLLHVPFPVVDIHGTERTLTIPVDAEVGSNWGHYNDDPKKGPINLGGLKRI